MSKTPRYLRNRKTGVVFPYNERMAGLDVMEGIDKLPAKEKRTKAMRPATFPMPKGQAPDPGTEEDNAPPPAKTEPLSEKDQIHEIAEKIKKERSKDGVIELAREFLGATINPVDEKGNDRKLVDLKNEAIDVINARLGHG